jgi:hypothetical protein
VTGQDSSQIGPPYIALVILVDNDQEENIFEIERFNSKYHKDKNLNILLKI